MANAILGSFELLSLASLIGIPIGVLGGVYLAEYGSARINAILRAYYEAQKAKSGGTSSS